MTRALCLLFILAALLTGAPATAAEIEGVSVPNRVRLGKAGPELVLNGAGVRTMLFFKVYVAALYLPERMADGEAILRSERPRRLLLHMLRDMSAEQVNSSTNDALRDTLTPEERAPLDSRMKTFNAIFDSLRELKAGMQVAIDYLPRQGTTVRINGEEKERIPGADFNQALLRIWLGARPRDSNLRQALLGNSDRGN